MIKNPVIQALENLANNELVKQFKEHDTNGLFEDDLNIQDIIEIRGSDEVNAWQHAYISGILSNNGLTKNMALFAGYFKELITPTQWSKDTLKDLYNNIKGVELAQKYSSKEDFANALFECQYENEPDKILSLKNPPLLVVDGENDQRIYDNILLDTFKELIFDLAPLPMIENIKDIFELAAQTDPIYRDPLLIDLNGDGITTTDVNNGIYFDHDVNGFAEKSAWVSNEDGILAFDVNNNGVIDNGSEIFGDAFLKPDGSSAQSGFDALSSLDSNNDNIIDANDSQFNNIKILKADGSLISLAEAGIVSISLNAQASNTVDENGNTQLNVSSFTKADGSTGSIADYTFVRDTLHTQATDIVEVPDDILALPDAQGYGNVLSLHQAMAKDSSGELKTLVQDFVNASSETDKLNLVKQIILKWTGVENIAADSRGEFYNAQQLAA